MQYCPSVYGGLTDSDSMRDLAARHISKLPELGEVICGYGLEDIVGVMLVHRHHDLSLNERLLWQMDEAEWVATPSTVSDRSICPLNWKIGGQGIENIYPLEFCPKEEGYAPETDASSSVMSSAQFLRDFAEKVIKLGAQDVFGLGLLQARPTFQQLGMVMLERSDTKKRITKAWLVPEETVGSLSEGVTLWHFALGGVGASRSCAYGNSRHCCGV